VPERTPPPADEPHRMPFALFPADDRTQQLRLKRQLMGFVSYLMFLLPLVYAVHHGWMDFGYAGLAGFAAAAVVINLGFFTAIRSGFSRRFRDPNLTLPQIACAMLLALAMIHHANEARSILLMLFVSSLFFGVFGLGTRQFLQLSATAVFGYAALLIYEYRGMPLDDPRFRLELLYFMTLAMIMLWMSLIGSYVARLRLKLAQKKAELGKAMARLMELVSHDELTGVFNRRHLMDILGREKERADRYGHTFAVCIIDLDHFKLVNDNHGHAVGDEVLCEFCNRMRACARKMDWLGRQDADTTFGRYGGEEFLLVLPHTPLAGAHRCIERIREKIQAEPIITAAGPLTVTFSAGLAMHLPGEPVSSTLSRADTALYMAKARGRNRTEACE
jgi:diguanylate cyclase